MCLLVIPHLCLLLISTDISQDGQTACTMADKRIVARLCIDALPEPLRNFYSLHSDALSERAVEPGGVWLRNPRLARRQSWHYLMLDADADNMTADSRIEATGRFPHQWAEARKLFRTHNIKHGGQLPWQLSSLVEELTLAFGKPDTNAIVKLSGYVIHFAADAANPFNTTRDPRGVETGNHDLGHFTMENKLFAHQDVSHRLYWELIRRNTQRYKEAVDPSRIRFDLNVNPPYLILEAMAESSATLPYLIAADRNVFEKMAINNATSLLAREEEFYLLLDNKCADYCIACIERATRLSTTLIVHAWHESGSPSHVPVTPEPNDNELQQLEPEALTGTPQQTSDGAQESTSKLQTVFVASKRSNIFHRPDCRHAARISKENIVEYASLEEAVASGKQPCKTCKPDTTDSGK